MIANISVWAKGIIIAVIVGTILEMCLPESKNKKYIKVVIGLYILFCIINPVVGKSINLENLSLDEYMSADVPETPSNKNASSDNNVSKLFQGSIKKQIKKELNTNGYDSNNIEIITDNDYNIIQINISDVFEYKENASSVNRIEINIKDKPAKGIAPSDKQKIIDDLKDTYKIDRSKIIIN